MMKNYKRRKGDNLLSNDPRLKYKWGWSRSATGMTEEELKKWTHFQCSVCFIDGWKLFATQWPDDYEARIEFNGSWIAEKEGFKTRIEAQIGAENLLAEWIQEQYEKIINDKS